MDDFLFVPLTPLPCARRTSNVACPARRPSTRQTLRMVIAPQRLTSETATKQLSVLLPEKLSDEGVALLSDTLNVDKQLNLTPEELLEKIADYDAIIIRSATKLTRQVIEAAPKLKVIGRAGVGVDNIDLPAATERGVLVVNAPTGNCVAAAEHAIALMCSLARLVSSADRTIKNGGWDRSKFVGTSLVGKTLGLIGLGRIGREVAKRALGLGMHVVASDPFTSLETAASIGVELLDTDDVLRKCDFLSLHVPLIESTRHLISARELSLMRDGSRLINAARGGVVDETALLAALESGRLAGAALDCFEFEPPGKHPGSISEQVAKHPAVLATPHLGASTKEAQEDVAVEIATAVRNALDGDLVPTMINAPAVPQDLLKALKPRAILCERLGRLAYYMNGGRVSGEVTVEYFIPKMSEDTRVLRAAVIKGIMEPALEMAVTIVNAESVAKQYNLKVTEVNHLSENSDQPSEIIVRVKDGQTVEGRVTNGHPHVTRIARYELDLRLEGIVVAYSQFDRPGQLGRVGTYLGENQFNISSMTLARECGDSDKALVLLGLDSKPDKENLKEICDLVGAPEVKPIVVEF